jgi:hypothetical protein
LVKEGSLKGFDVDHIQKTYCQVHIQDDSENLHADQQLSASSVKPLPSKPLSKPSDLHADQQSSVKPLPSKPLSNPSRTSARISTGKQAQRPESSNASVRVTRSHDKVSPDADGDDDDADDEKSASEIDVGDNKTKPQAPVKSGKSGKGPPKPPNSRKRARSSTKEPIRKQAPMSASKVEDFFWATLPNHTETCIDTLELLAEGKIVHADVEKEGLALLVGRCRALHSLYANQEFQEFLAIAQEALESYEGKQSPYQRQFMLQELKKFGFVVSPRMWSKLELLMLMVIILDPKLMYMGIRQKDRKDERDQNR